MCRRLLIALVVLCGVAVLSDVAWKKKAYAKTLDGILAVDEVDMGVVLHVVERDPNGQELVSGAPTLRIVDTIRRGGLVAISVDPATGKRVARWTGPSRNPVVWHCSREQAPLIVHDDGGPLWQLIQGSEGSGKTTVIPMWAAFRAMEHIGTEREIGITAPTTKRMAHIRRAIQAHWPESWYRYVDDTKLYTFHTGPRVQLVSAHQRSEAEGSPIQGYNWVAHAGDELQDHFDRDGDIIARGRSAPNGRYKRINTSTFKDSTEWRNFKAAAEKNDRWGIVNLYGLHSPFIDSDHWESMRKGLTPREYRRRVLALDVGPERQVYYQWSRHEADLLDPYGEPQLDARGQKVRRVGNLRPVPLGAIDVTARELARFGHANHGVLIGHDPGKRQHVSEFLKAYEFPNDQRVVAGRVQPAPVRWFVVDEITTPESTVEAHVAAVKQRVSQRWRCNLADPYTGLPSAHAPTALVRIDPHTEGGSEHPDRTVYSQWRNAGFKVMAAAYNPKTQKPTPIKVDARIDLLNTLLCNTDGEVRLFIACDDHGNAAAPRLLKAFETMECDESGNAEHERKDARDLSHWPCSVAFAVWSIEKPRVDALRGAA